MHYNFIEIGTSDFNTEIQTCSPDQVGLSIDPLLMYLRNLPTKPHVLKVLAAVSDEDGFVDIYFCPKEVIERHSLPWWISGSNSINAPHPLVRNYLLDHGIDPEVAITKVKVPKISIITLLQIYQVSSCDFLKIDTEGHDCVILKKYIDAIRSGITQPARRIQFESNELTPDSTVDKMIQDLERVGYRLVSRNRSDTIMQISI